MVTEPRRIKTDLDTAAANPNGKKTTTMMFSSFGFPKKLWRKNWVGDSSVLLQGIQDHLFLIGSSQGPGEITRKTKTTPKWDPPLQFQAKAIHLMVLNRKDHKILVGIYFINNSRVDDYFNGRLDLQGLGKTARSQTLKLEHFSELHRNKTENLNHQGFQVPKMEVLNLIMLFRGWVFPYINLAYSLYR